MANLPLTSEVRSRLTREQIERGTWRFMCEVDGGNRCVKTISATPLHESVSHPSLKPEDETALNQFLLTYETK